MADHKRDDADIVDFVESLNPRRRRSVRRTPTRRILPIGPAPRRWTVPLIAVAGALFAMGGGIALAASSEEPPEVDCTIQVPANPLSAQGLATPYQLSGGGCHESDDGTSAFVQATVIDPATGAISVYNPLVIDEGTKPAAAPVVPQLPAGAVVGIWFGFNGDNLTLGDSGGSLKAGVCVNGLGDSIFGQYAYCNAPAFFTAANAAIAAGKVSVPPLGTANDGLACPTTRDFGIVDQDQSDNVTTTYLFLPDGTTAQNSAANQAKLAAKGAKVLANGSDNGLLDDFVDPALGCNPWQVPDLADGGKPVPALALNELQAAAYQSAPVALIPTNDPMALVDGRTSVRKTNLYRAGVNMGPIDTATETPVAYCQNMLSIGISRTTLDRAKTVKETTPDAGAANNLFTFLAQRMSGSFDELDCGDLMHIANPVKVVTNGDGVAINASFAPVPPPPSASPSAAPSSARPSTSAQPSASASTAPSRPASGSPAPSTSPTGRTTNPPPASGPAVPPSHAPTGQPTQAPPTRPSTVPTAGPTGAPVPPPTHPATTAAAQPRPAATTAAARTNNQPPPATGAKPPANPGDQGGPAVVPAGNSAVPDAGAVVASGDPAVPMDSAAPAPSLTLGPMPLKAAVGKGGGGGVGSMPPARLAGTVLLSGGGAVVVGLLIRGLVNVRRRRARFVADF